MNNQTELAQRIYGVFKSADADIYFYNDPEYKPEAEIEFEISSEETFSCSIQYERTYEDFIRKFTEAAEKFDPDHYATAYILKHVEVGTPISVRGIIQDAEEIRNRLLTIAAKLRNTEEEYTVTVAVSGSIDIKVTTTSFKEAESLAETEVEERLTGIMEHFGVRASHAEDPRGYRHYYD